jgi:hypothetical protein
VLSWQDGDFEYYIGPPKNPKAPASGPGSGPYPAHVGSCNGCMPSNGVVGSDPAGGSQTVAKNIAPAQQRSTSSQAASLQEVRIYCDPQPNSAAKADPLSVGSGQAFDWKFLGNGPKTGPAFEVTIKGNSMCSNHVDGDKVTSATDFCTAGTAGTYTYTFKANACTPPSSIGTITVTP